MDDDLHEDGEIDHNVDHNVEVEGHDFSTYKPRVKHFTCLRPGIA